VRLRRIFVAVIGIVVGAVVLAYVLDYAVFRVRAATTGNAYGSVTVNHCSGDWV
jgi:hypothetical protein